MTFLDDESEAAEAEQALKDLEEESGDKMDTSEDSLRALILKRQANRSGFLDSLEEKYANQNDPPAAKSRSKKNSKKSEKKRKSAAKEKKSSYDMDDSEFEKIQAKLDKKKRKKAAK